MLELLQNLPEPEHRTVVAFDDEYRNEIFAWAAERACLEFRSSTWLAFWRSCVENEPIAEVADSLTDVLDLLRSGPRLHQDEHG